MQPEITVSSDYVSNAEKSHDQTLFAEKYISADRAGRRET